MKKFSVLFLFVALFATVSHAQGPGTSTDALSIDVPADGPNAVFEKTTVDYGTIEQNSDPYRYFAFTNTGNEPLIISKAKGSCGCTAPEWPKEPIMPGETSEIKVRYDTKRVGPFTKTVTLTTNQAQPTIVLKITGKVLAAEETPSVPQSTGGF